MIADRWRRMMVVVEIPIRGHETETGLCNAIRDTLNWNEGSLLTNNLAIHVKIGTPRVKSYKRVVNAEVRKRLKEIRQIKSYWSKR